MIALGEEADVTFSYSGISEDEALALAERLDWKAIRAAAQAKWWRALSAQTDAASRAICARKEPGQSVGARSPQ